MFITHNQVRMHDVDQAGVLYFARQFRFTHEALEDFVEQEWIGFHRLFTEEDFLFVIVHCEADYYAPVKLNDRLEIHLSVGDVGKSSFTVLYNIYNDQGEEVGAAKTIHCTIKRTTRKKIDIPEKLRGILTKHRDLPPAIREEE